MYYLFGILLLFICFFSLLHCWRKRKILCKLACMTECEKYDLLNTIVEPFGYLYNPEWDVFSSRIDAWQKQFGYGTIYDRLSPFFNMVFQALPIYFDYDGKTWLIQVWKGQYGICTGCEVGIYHADGLIDKKHRDQTIFHAVDETEMMDLSLEIWRKGRRLASLSERHWWLTAFDVGTFSKPSQLSLDVSIRFPNCEMKEAFYIALLEQGIDYRNVFSYHTTVYFHMPRCPQRFTLWQHIHGFLIQCSNHFHCQLFRFATRCCCSCCDRILYLYFYLPFFCRRLFKFRHFRKKRKRR